MKQVQCSVAGVVKHTMCQGIHKKTFLVYAAAAALAAVWADVLQGKELHTLGYITCSTR
jgi:hypothetical protein